MSRFKRMLVLILCVALLYMMASPSIALTENAELAERDRQIDVATAYGNICSAAISEDKQSYAPEFAGGYYDIAQGKLVVLLTQDSTELQSRYLAESKSTDSIVEFKTAKYSINDLLNIIEKVRPDFESKFEIALTGIDTEANVAVLGIVPDHSDEATKYMETTYASANLPIRVDPVEKSESKATLIGGKALWRNNSPVATLGLCGTYNGSNAILTCGHGGMTEDPDQNNPIDVDNTSTLLGYVVEQQYENQEPGDYSVVSTGSHTLTNQVYGTSTSNILNIVGTVSRVAKNETVYNYGKNGGQGKHTVVYDFVGIKHSDTMTVTQMEHCSIVSGGTIQNGDSGGPIYMQNSQGRYVACGVLSSGSSTTMGFCPLDVVTDDFSVKVS